MSPIELCLMLALHSGILFITYDRVPTSVDFYLFLTSVFIYSVFSMRENKNISHNLILTSSSSDFLLYLSHPLYL